MSVEAVITFGQLCAIKREAMGLTKQEAIEKMKYKNAARIESGESAPRSINVKKLVDFYRITEEELKNVKLPEIKRGRSKIKMPAKKRGVTECIRIIDEMIDSVSDLKLDGALGDLICDEAMKNLRQSRECLSGLSVLDKLL